MRALLLLLAALSLGADPGPPAPAEAPPVRWSVRSRLFLRLDPGTRPDPDGTAEPGALGQFRLVAREGMPADCGRPSRRDDPACVPLEAEAAAWIGHAPGAAPFADDGVVGDVTTLRARTRLGPVWLEGGRHWTTVGGLRLTRLSGLTAGVGLGRVEVAGRVGLVGEQPHELAGENLEFGGEVRARLPQDLRLSAGVLSTAPADGPARTRWTFAGDWLPNLSTQARAAATVDVVARALVEARVELMAEPAETLWLRGYGRYAAIDQLLPFGDLLAVFAPDPRGELGGLAEWMAWTTLRLRLDAAWVGIRDDHVGGRVRAGTDFLPSPGTQWTLEATGTSGPQERTGLLRVAGRTPIRGTVFGTVEALGDFIEGQDPGGVARAGAGFEPWAGWFTYGALELGRSARWADRLAGLVMLEHALGAPVRWGGAP